jgi:hypothetical protein
MGLRALVGMTGCSQAVYVHYLLLLLLLLLLLSCPFIYIKVNNYY